MRNPIYSLRTGILAHLGFLILSALLLMNMVMVKFAEKDLLRSRFDAGGLLLQIVGEKLPDEINRGDNKWIDIKEDMRLNEEIERLVKVSGFSRYLIINGDGSIIFGSKAWGNDEGIALANCRNVIATGKNDINFYGTGWGVIWLAHKKMHISAPVRDGNRVIGAITIGEDLDSIYRTLRESEKTALIYIALNTIVLVVFGIYLLSRSVVKPIHRLIGITEKFELGGPFPYLADTSRNEIGQLSHSLTLMLKRLEENKKELKKHISTLEQANLELKKAQQEIIRSEKLASVGRLATGVAHEIGNPIGIILGYLELVRGESMSPEERADFLDRIESEITRVNIIIRQLLDFSRPTNGKPGISDVHPLLNEVLEMLKPQPMMARIEIIKDLKSGSDKVWADPDQLKQVFLNIILNAADAMCEDCDENLKNPDNILRIHSDQKGNTLSLSFTDTGPGISQEAISHIFDPFYTTKEPGMGTGLGLSVSYRIIEALGGTIRAESTLGEGTTIIVDIPLKQDKNGL